MGNYYNETETSSYEQRRDKEISKISKIVSIVLAGLFVIITIFNCAYSVEETETAVITTFGVATVNNGKGLQFKIPYLQKKEIVDSTIKTMTIGYEEDEEGNFYDVDAESIMITSDLNLVDADFNISYRVSDPIKYLYNSDEPEMILRNISLTSIRSTVAAYTVDSTLTIGKAELQSNIRQMIVEKLEEEDIGLMLDDVLIQDIEPPTEEVKASFLAVDSARSDKESLVNEANKYRNETLPAATADADQIIQDAEAQKAKRIAEAQSQVSILNAEYEEYKKFPLITKQRMFFEAMEELLPGLKVIIETGDGNIEKYYPVESFADITVENNK